MTHIFQVPQDLPQCPYCKEYITPYETENLKSTVVYCLCGKKFLTKTVNYYMVATNCELNGDKHDFIPRTDPTDILEYCSKCDYVEELA